MASFRELSRAFMARREAARLAGIRPPDETRTKLGHYELLDRIGAPHATVYHVLRRKDLTAAHLSRPCMIKPVLGTAAIGCSVLSGRNPATGLWWELRSGRWIDLESIRAGMSRVAEQRAWWGDQWLIEELLRAPGGGVPVEYQVFVFGDGAALILGRHTQDGAVRSRWFTPDWVDADIGRDPPQMDPEIPLPSDPAGVLELAGQVARAVPATFSRVDLYDSHRGLVVGEVNDSTGNLKFCREWDERLGQAWEQALKSS